MAVGPAAPSPVPAPPSPAAPRSGAATGASPAPVAPATSDGMQRTASTRARPEAPSGPASAISAAPIAATAASLAADRRVRPGGPRRVAVKGGRNGVVVEVVHLGLEALAQLHRARAQLRIGLQAGVDRVGEALGEVGPMLAQRRHALADPARGLGRRAPGGGVHPGPAFVGGEPQGVDVGLGTHALALGLLGRHVGQRSHHLAGCREALRAGDAGDPEVHQLGAAPRGLLVAHDHVLGLDVAVDDAALVRVREAVAEIGRDLGHVAVAEPAIGPQAGQGGARDELGHEDRPSIALAELVERDDRRMVEARGGLSLAQDAVGIRGEDLLEGDLALQALVKGPVHRAHPPGADPLDHPESAHHQLVRHDLLRSPAGAALLPSAPSAAAFILWPPNSDLGLHRVFPRRGRTTTGRIRTGLPPRGFRAPAAARWCVA